MTELLLGLGLGFSAGIAPGPLLGLVLSSSLRGGLAAGWRVSVAPLLTDLPIIALCLTAVAALPERAVAALAVGGTAFVAWLAYGALRDARTANLRPDSGSAEEVEESARALRRGVLVNALSPHPWLFWLGAGAPLLTAAWRAGPAHALGFLGGFYLMLVGSKVVLAAVTAAGRSRLSTRWYRRLLAGSGVLLLAAAVALAWEYGPRLF